MCVIKLSAIVSFRMKLLLLLLYSPSPLPLLIQWFNTSSLLTLDEEENGHVNLFINFRLRKQKESVPCLTKSPKGYVKHIFSQGYDRVASVIAPVGKSSITDVKLHKTRKDDHTDAR